MNIDKYLKNTPLEIVKKDLNEITIYIRNIEDLERINLDDRELQIIKLWFGLNSNSHRLNLVEISSQFQICKSRVNSLAKRALNKIRVHFSIINKADYINSILCLNLSTKAFQALYRANIKTIKELLSKSDDGLMSIKGLGERNFKEIKEALSNYGKESVNEPQKVNASRLADLIKEVYDLENTKRQLEERLGEIDEAILQAKANIENLRSEAQNDRK